MLYDFSVFEKEKEEWERKTGRRAEKIGSSLCEKERAYSGSLAAYSAACETTALQSKTTKGSKIKSDMPITTVVATIREILPFLETLLTSGSKKYASTIPTTNGSSTERKAYKKPPLIKNTNKNSTYR